MRISRLMTTWMVVVFLYLIGADLGGNLHAADDYELPYALEFDAKTSYVDLGVIGIMEGVSELTIEHWVYFNGKQGGWQRTVASDDNNVAHIITSKGNLFFRIADADGNWQSWAVSENGYPVNEWFHVAAVYNGEDCILYQNGQEVGRKTIGSVTTPTPNDIVGFSAAQSGGSHNPEAGIDGMMSEVRIYDRALSGEEIAEHMDDFLTGNKEGLVGYWPMEEGKGDAVYDKSGNDNHGTIVGAEWTKALKPSEILAESPESALPVLIDIAEEHPSDSVRRQAVEELGRLDVATEEVAPLLLDILKDTEDTNEVRTAALDAMDEADILGKDIVPVLLDILKNTEDTNAVRQAALDSLVKSDMAVENITPVLRDILTDTEDTDAVRVAVFDTMEEADVLDEDMASDIVKLLREDEITLRRRAFRVLSSIGSASIPPLKRELEENSKAPVRVGIITLIGLIEPDIQQVQPDLIRAAREDPAPRVRKRAVRVLSNLDPEGKHVEANLLDTLQEGIDEELKSAP